MSTNEPYVSLIMVTNSGLKLHFVKELLVSLHVSDCPSLVGAMKLTGIISDFSHFRQEIFWYGVFDVLEFGNLTTGSYMRLVCNKFFCVATISNRMDCKIVSCQD